VEHLLTETPLFYLCCCKGEHREYFDHDLNDDIDHRSLRRKRDLGINLEAFEEIADTVKDLNKSIIACTDTGSCLIDPAMTRVP
jgi:hypothetical protein